MSKENIPFFRRICRKFVYLTAPIWSDKTFLRMYFWCNLGYKLNLKSPRTFNEKLNWLKIYNKHPEYSKMVDKKEAKEYVASIVGDKYIIPTLAVYDKVEDIDFEKLPKQFVLKCTHDSGSVVVCKDKSILDKGAAIRKLKKGLRSNFFTITREYPYKNVKPRIIAEQYMEDETGELRDYKFFCFNGVADIVMVCIDRQIHDTKFYFFDKKWNLLPLNIRGKNTDPSFKLPRPECIEQMFDLAGRLSEGVPFLRVDFYSIDNHPYFGELTFFPDSGFDANLLPETDKMLGERTDLSIVKPSKH